MASFTSAYSGEITTRDYRLRGGAPVLRGDGYGVALLLGYSGTHLDVAMPGTGERGAPLYLHRFDATLGGGGALAPGWSLRASAGATHASDLDDTPWHALEVTSSAMIHHVLCPSDAVFGGLVYTSSAEFFPVLPILGYVHHPAGGRFRFDVFLPRHVRAEYEMHARIRGALGVEATGTTWAIRRAGSERVRRVGGTAFAEVQLVATAQLRVEVRAGLSVDRYTLPGAMAGADDPLRPAGFAQIAVLLAP